MQLHNAHCKSQCRSVQYRPACLQQGIIEVIKCTIHHVIVWAYLYSSAGSANIHSALLRFYHALLALVTRTAGHCLVLYRVTKTTYTFRQTEPFTSEQIKTSRRDLPKLPRSNGAAGCSFSGNFPTASGSLCGSFFPFPLLTGFFLLPMAASTKCGIDLYGEMRKRTS